MSKRFFVYEVDGELWDYEEAKKRAKGRPVQRWECPVAAMTLAGALVPRLVKLNGTSYGLELFKRLEPMLKPDVEVEFVY